MPKQKSTTRIYFPPLKLTENNLPNIYNVICAIIFESAEKKTTCVEAISIVTKQVISVWNKCSIPVIHTKSVRMAIKKHYQNYLKIVESDMSRKTYTQKLDEFKVLVFLNFLITWTCKKQFNRN